MRVFKRRIRVGTKSYKYYDSHRKKSSANQRIEQLRQKGWNAIMVEREDSKGRFYRIYRKRRKR